MLHPLCLRAFASPCAHACCMPQVMPHAVYELMAQPAAAVRHLGMPRLLKLLTTTLCHLRHSTACAASLCALSCSCQLQCNAV